MKARIFCSFCGKSELEVEKMVGSPDGEAFICGECITLCYTVVKEDAKTND